MNVSGDKNMTKRKHSKTIFRDTDTSADNLRAIMKASGFEDATKSAIIRMAIRELARRVTRKAKA